MVNFVLVAEDAVRKAAKAAFTRFADVAEEAIDSIERALVDEGLALDKEADDALAVLKSKLSDLKDRI